MHRHRHRSLVAAGLLACTPSHVDEPTPPEDLPPAMSSAQQLNPADSTRADSTRAEPHPLPTALSQEKLEPLTWKRVQFTEAGFELDVLDGDYSTHAWPQGGVLQQVLRFGVEDYALSILVRAGDGEDIAQLRRESQERGAHVSALTETTTCGLPSQHLEIAQPAEDIECIQYADGRPNSPGRITAKTVIAEAFRLRDLDVVARWEVPTALREHFREDERRFFSGLTCPPGS